MRRTICLFVILGVAAGLFAAYDFSAADAALADSTLWESTYNQLAGDLETAENAEQKAQFCWRLSRLACVIGDSCEKTEDKRIWFGRGIEYADMGAEADPLQYMCYMWRCANRGRDIQTRSLMAQAGGVGDLLADLGTIIDKLGQVDLSEAWQALAEVYWHHPFMSTSDAVSFLRRAVDTIPQGEIRLTTYKAMAQILASRNWSASKRRTELEKEYRKWQEGSFDSNTAKYANYEGRSGSSVCPPWSTKTLGELSDKQEAKIILMYSMMLFDTMPNPSDTDRAEYAAIEKMLSGM